ncbi:uncharacterized protein V1510DRAFT_401906 [Dipodascopsis tothii]|uniref:uncharacterized protein n=1 Tax=Dipodascopsis tothii TaxID=44089 RepID=UPI0034CF86D1
MASAPATPATRAPTTLRPILRPILPKPPAGGRAPALAPGGGYGLAAKPATTVFGSGVMGSVASSIFAGSATIKLPPRPSSSRSKAKKRTSPDRVLATVPPDDVLSTSACALKKRRRAKVSASPAALLIDEEVEAAFIAVDRGASTRRPHITIAHSAPSPPHYVTPVAAAFSPYDALSPSSFSLPGPSQDFWWPKLNDTDVRLPLYDHDGDNDDLSASELERSTPSLTSSASSIASSRSSLSAASTTLSAATRLLDIGEDAEDEGTDATSALFSGLEELGLVEDDDPFTFLDLVDNISNEVVESAVGW